MYAYPDTHPPIHACMEQLSLKSDRATFLKHSKYTREQEVTLEEEPCYKSAWSVQLYCSALPLQLNIVYAI